MPTEKEKRHNDYVEKLEQDAYIHRQQLPYASYVDDLLKHVILRDKKSLSAEEQANYAYYREKMAGLRQEFEKNTGMTYMVPESKWPKDPATRKQWRKDREKARIEYYEDEARHELLGDEKFTKGAELARFLEADNDVLACAAGLLREKQAAYKRMSAVGRFFSYLNPFYDEYREERKAISKLKQKVVAATKCDKKKLDDYVNGKTDEIYSEDKETLPYNSLHSFLIQANRYQIFGDPFADKMNNAPQANAEMVEDLSVQTDLDRQNDKTNEPQNGQPTTESERNIDQPAAGDTSPTV